MCWGSMWLYKATGEDKYLAEARKWFDGSADWGMSWDDKIVGCQVDFVSLLRLVFSQCPTVTHFPAD